MDLIFNEINGRWESEMMVTADFNLHIEGLPEGNVSVYQRGTESGEYAYVRGATPYPSVGTVYEYDFSAVIFPKYIKVSCASAPSLAVVTSEGEVVPIEKPVEPDTPSEPEMIEYHFEIPMHEESEFGIEIQLSGKLEGDFSETFDRLKSYLIANGERIGNSLGLGVRFSEIPLENPKITINNLFVTDIYMYSENSLEIELGTNGGSDMSCDSTAFLTRTSISITTPKP